MGWRGVGRGGGGVRVKVRVRACKCAPEVCLSSDGGLQSRERRCLGILWTGFAHLAECTGVHPVMCVYSECDAPEAD